jgi:sec-independent protein translocase protein TatA
MGFGTTEMIIIAAVFILLFGGAKLPSLMRNMGRSINEFKAGMEEKPADRKIEDKEDATVDAIEQNREAVEK